MKTSTDLPVAFVLFLALAAVGVGKRAALVALILTFLGGVLLLGCEIIIIVRAPVPPPVLLVHLVREEDVGVLLVGSLVI